VKGTSFRCYFGYFLCFVTIFIALSLPLHDLRVFQYRELAAFLNFMIETLWFSMYMLNSVVNTFNSECIAKFCAGVLM